jgi:hypothetical protein
MDRFNALGRGMQIMLVAGVLLLIVMFFPWQDFGPDIVEFSGWEGLTGVVLGLLTILLVAWIVLRLVAVDLRLPVSQALVTAALAGLLLLFAVFKLLTIIDDEATAWAYIGFILALAIGVGAWMTIQAAGGIETLKTEVSTLQSPTPTAPPPPEPSAPAAPEAGAAAEPTPPGTPVMPAPPPEPAPTAEPAPPEEPVEPPRPAEPEPPRDREP